MAEQAKLDSLNDSLPNSSFFSLSTTGKIATHFIPKSAISLISSSKTSNPTLEIPGIVETDSYPLMSLIKMGWIRSSLVNLLSAVMSLRYLLDLNRLSLVDGYFLSNIFNL